MADHDAIWDHLDGQQARRLAEVFGLDGWLVEWERVEGEWEARLSGPALPGRMVGRGLSRVSAISKAHVLAIRRLRLGEVPESAPSLKSMSLPRISGRGSSPSPSIRPILIPSP